MSSTPPAVFEVIAHMSGHSGRPISILTRAPWLYAIFSFGSKLVYVGETHEVGGVAGRLADHFGPLSASTMRQAASRVAGRAQVEPPFIVVAGMLPSVPNLLDPENKRVRQAYEAI